jgi:uncharacterized phiE125 gp8 family phage protein
LIEGLIASARDWCESYTGRAFVFQTIALTLDGFPYGGGYFNRAIREAPTLNNFLPTHSGIISLERPPFHAMTSIVYLDSTATLHTLDPSIYRVISGSKSIPKLTTQPNKIWPVTYPLIGSAVITYVAGYSADASKVPEGIKAAIKMLVSHWYNNRDAVAEGGMAPVPLTVEALLMPWETGQYR